MPLPLTTILGLELARGSGTGGGTRGCRDNRPPAGALGPGLASVLEKTSRCIADPQAGLGGEPIQSPQPLGGRVQARVVEDLRFSVAGPFAPSCGCHSWPFQCHRLWSRSLSGQQSQPHRVVHQLEDELRLGRVRDAELFPVHAVAALGPAQMHQQPVAQLAHRDRGWLAQCSSNSGGGALRNR